MHEYRVRRANVEELDRLELDLNALAAEGFKVIHAASYPGDISDTARLESSLVVLLKRMKKAVTATTTTT